MKLFKNALTAGLILIMPVLASAQDDAGVLTGTVYGPNGETVQDMPIQATHTISGAYERTFSADNGHYRMTNLEAGSYTVTISTPCCAYLYYENDEIEIATGEAMTFEIHLAEGSSFNTIGDDPGIIATAVRNRQHIPDLPVPRTDSGKPDLSGLWLMGEDPFPATPDVQPWAAELFAERIANDVLEHPHNQCLPGDPPIPGAVAPFMTKIVQTPSLMVMLFEDVPGFRQIFLDGRDHPEDPNPSWLGHSIAHWDGDVLVVDTIGFNSRGWMAIYPRTEQLHLIERYTRTEYGRIELEVTIEDPGVFNESWKQNLPFYLVPQEELIEYVCENNKWAPTYEN